MIPRRAAKRDASEAGIVSALERCGFTVYRLDRPCDLLVGFRRRTWLVEVKSGHKGYGKSLNKNQQEFADKWRGSDVVVLHTVGEAIDWASRMSREAA